MISIGMIGESEGNGHPYSFSCIINGFDKDKFNRKDWPNIYNYLLENSVKEKIGFDDAKVTHVWCPVYDNAVKIAEACNIANTVKNLEELLVCDAIIIARDDWETHFPIAKIFLLNDKFVFVDKPLTLNNDELEFFKSYINNGKLFSCSALRYADELNTNIPDINLVDTIIGTTIKNWDKYAIHIIEPILSKYDLEIYRIEKLFSNDCLEIRFLHNDKNITFIFYVVKKFKFPFLKFEVLADRTYHYELNNHYKAFKNTLRIFIDMIKNKTVPIQFGNTKKILSTIILGM
ncbi:MAG TPA: Gfo/Idh/MocA family oxidoreductase [Ignavibacteriales bacterium]|nr:Gfo/Idh/MocA family oxidoreductase [Ignavibacteriales bacterium]